MGGRRGGLMVSALVPGASGPGSSPLTVPLSTQVYKWVPVNCWGKPNKMRGNDL